MYNFEQKTLLKRIYDDDLGIQVRTVLRERFLKPVLLKAGHLNDNPSTPTVFGMAIGKTTALLNSLAETKSPYTKNCQKHFNAITSKLNARNAILEQTKKEIVRAYARKNLIGINRELQKTFNSTFYRKFEIQRHVNWKLCIENLKGPSYEPGAYVDMVVKRYVKENALQKKSAVTFEEETGIRHAAIVKQNMFVRDNLLAHFKSPYMPKDTQYTAGSMIKMVTAINRCAFALNNISHLRKYDSCSLLFDAARKSGRSFKDVCSEFENISCLSSDSTVIISKDIPLLQDITKLFKLYNPPLENNKTGGMNIKCPNNVLFVDIDSIHKSLVSESLIWRFILKRKIGGESLQKCYSDAYVNGVAPFNVCQEFPGLFGILTHFLNEKDPNQFRRLLSALHRIQGSSLIREYIDTAADIMIELLYRIDDAAAIIDNTSWSFDETRYKRYLKESSKFLSNNILQVV